MLADKNGKLFGKISLLDIGIIILVILCIIGAYVRLSGAIVSKGENVTIEYTYTLKGVRDTSVEALTEKKGEVYSNDVSCTPMGKIVNVEAKQAYDTSELANGGFAYAPVKDRYDVVVTIQVEGKKNDTALTTNTNKRIEAGSSEFIKTKWIAMTGQISSTSTKAL